MTVNKLIKCLESAKRCAGRDDLEIQVQLPNIPGAVSINYVSIDRTLQCASIWTEGSDDE